ncbi:Enoyl-CoA hydratase/isomerase family protein [Trichostrongylus colubriformis]|uniref:Ethylmalonyl-CoA decarboxylase n=1 Tax=Trichostrongylus colubriformis TaxID=6319 RepID=A0AAN8G1V7_TRICO
MSVCTRSLYLWKVASRLSSSHITPQLAEVLHRWPGGQIELVSEGHVARLRFNRPDKNNCFSGEMMFQLGERVQDLDKVSSCGVLVVEGVGKSFCTGGDLGLIDELSNPSSGAAMYRFMSSSLAKFRTCPLVSVARLHGHCLGGGTEIASSCDIRVAHKDTKIGFMQARLGIVPSWGAADYFASIVGRSTALRLMTTAAMISASEAKDIGFVDVVYDSDEDFEEFISSMLKHGAEVCRAQKAMVRAVENGNEDEKLDVVRSVWGGPAQKNAIMKQMDALKQKK